jgi:hypothetical protein
MRKGRRGGYGRCSNVAQSSASELFARSSLYGLVVEPSSFMTSGAGRVRRISRTEMMITQSQKSAYGNSQIALVQDARLSTRPTPPPTASQPNQRGARRVRMNVHPAHTEKLPIATQPFASSRLPMSNAYVASAGVRASARYDAASQWALSVRRTKIRAEAAAILARHGGLPSAVLRHGSSPLQVAGDPRSLWPAARGRRTPQLCGFAAGHEGRLSLDQSTLIYTLHLNWRGLIYTLHLNWRGLVDG